MAGNEKLEIVEVRADQVRIGDDLLCQTSGFGPNACNASPCWVTVHTLTPRDGRIVISWGFGPHKSDKGWPLHAPVIVRRPASPSPEGERDGATCRFCAGRLYADVEGFHGTDEWHLQRVPCKDCAEPEEERLREYVGRRLASGLSDDAAREMRGVLSRITRAEPEGTGERAFVESLISWADTIRVRNSSERAGVIAAARYGVADELIEEHLQPRWLALEAQEPPREAVDGLTALRESVQADIDQLPEAPAYDVAMSFLRGVLRRIDRLSASRGEAEPTWMSKFQAERDALPLAGSISPPAPKEDLTPTRPVSYVDEARAARGGADWFPSAGHTTEEGC